MDHLPVEIINVVYSFLDAAEEDIGRFRRTCKCYADVGRPHLFRAVHLVFTPNSFSRLGAIYSDPTSAPHVTTLLYEADPQPFRTTCGPKQNSVVDPTTTTTTTTVELDISRRPDMEWVTRRCQRRLHQIPLRRRYSPSQLPTIYRKFVEYGMNQAAMRKDEYPAGNIANAMARLPNLENIYLTLAGGVGGQSSNIVAGGDFTGQRIGLQQMLSLLRGSARSQMRLKRFCAGFVDWTVFKQSDQVFQDLQKAVRNLQELSLHLATSWRPPNGFNTVESEVQECAEYLKNGRVGRFLAAAPNLGLLDLRFDWDKPICPAELRYVVGKHKWEFLAAVALSTFDSRAEDLAGFCETHAMTLRHLVLNCIKLVEGSWSPTFQRMRELLRLERVEIRGDLEAFEFHEFWRFTSMGAGGETKMSRVVQEYLLQGGHGPLLDLNKHNEPCALELIL